MVLQPGNILVVLTRKMVSNLTALDHRWGSAWISPLFDLRMAVSERKAARTTMVKSGQIIKAVQPWIVRIPIHLRAKVACVHAVFAHVEEYE